VACKSQQQGKLLAELLFILVMLLHEHIYVTSTPWQKMSQANPHLPVKDCAVKKTVPEIVFQGTCHICAVYNHISSLVGKSALSLLKDMSGALLLQMETFASQFQQHVSELQCCKQTQ